DVLLKGRPEQQALARTEIAMILEARGHTADAEEAYWTNVQARCTDRRAYERLIAIYQANGDRLSESLVRQQLDEVFSTVPSADGGAGQGGSRQASAGRSPGSHGRTAQGGMHPGGSGSAHRGGRPGANATLPPQRVRRLRSARQSEGGSPDRNGAVPALPPPVEPVAMAPVEPPAPPVLSPPPVTATGPGSAAGHAYAAIAQGVQPAAPQPVPQAAPTPPPTRQMPAAEPFGQAAPRSAPPVAGEVVRPGATAGAGRRRTAPLSPNPQPAAPRGRFNTGGLIVLEPATIGAFLLASFGAAAIIAFLLIAAERGFGSSANASPAVTPTPLRAATQMPPRCTDASLRFPGLNVNDPLVSVAAGYRANGVDINAPRPGGTRLTPEQAEQVLGGWMAISLLMDRSGQPAPTLAGWLDDQTDRPTLANAMLAGRRVEAMITADEWATMRGWPATTCEGAFLNNPQNARAIQMMERVVGR
ncbi:MAG: hypothetical protein AB7P40_23885, partial [Chloroflexota bacterium]